MNQKQTYTEQSQSGMQMLDTILRILGEEDLLSTNPDDVKSKREGESEEDYAIRMEQYNNALEECERIIEMMERGDAHSIRMAKHEKKNELKAVENAQRKKDIQSAEEQLNSTNQ